MTVRSTSALIADIRTAYEADNYRAMQKALKAYRSAGNELSIKLNCKKVAMRKECQAILYPETNKTKTQYNQQGYDWWANFNKEAAEAKAREEARAKAREERAAKAAKEAADNLKEEKAKHDSHIRHVAHFWRLFKTAGTAKDAKRTYRKLAMQHHPDHGGEVATFLALQESWESYQRTA